MKLRAGTFAGGAALVVCFGCASAPRAVAHFDGFSRRCRVGPERIESAAELPVTYESLGSVSAHCTRISGQRRMQREWLSDVACSAELLRRALRTRAAEVGGTLLVGERCSSRSEAASRPDGPRISCRALVAAPRRAEPRKTAAGPTVGSTLDDDQSPSVEEVWNTRVDYTPRLGVAPRGHHGVGLVAELPSQPADHVVLGDVTVHCGAGCSLDGARETVRRVAASVGVDAAVEVRCVHEELGWLCVGRAAAYERDPGWSGRSP